MTSSFGTLPEGDAVTGVRISAGRLRATILSWGATLQDLRFDPADNRSDIPLVLGFNSIDDYLVHGRFHGAAILLQRHSSPPQNPDCRCRSAQPNPGCSFIPARS